MREPGEGVVPDVPAKNRKPGSLHENQKLQLLGLPVTLVFALSPDSLGGGPLLLWPKNAVDPSALTIKLLVVRRYIISLKSGAGLM